MMMAFTAPILGMQREKAVAPAKPETNKLLSLSSELDALRRDHAVLQQAIFEAAQIQRRLCMPRELTCEPFEIAGEIFPVRHLSGDFFKVTESRSALNLVLGDIAGKGLSAGIWQAHLMGLIRRAAQKNSDPAAAVAEVNQQLCADEGQPPLAALFFARVDTRSSELRYSNAGLPAPLLLRDDKTLESLGDGGPMLGAMQNAAFQSGTVVLHPGDMLVAFSDGVTECRNSQDQEFETERLATAARAVLGKSAGSALFSLLGTVLDFADSSPPADDITLLVVRRQSAAVKERSRLRKKVSAPHRRSASASPPNNSDGRGHGSK
jgi:serine phosphatase RsbU (regulator of sigma subunit)